MNFLLKTKKNLFIFALVLLLTPCSFSFAYQIIDTSTDINGDFVLEPAKKEVLLDAGQSEIEMLNILNRTDKTLEFKIEIEDFSGSHDPNQTVILSGEERGPYSLKDYLSPEIDSFTLKPGQKITFPVEISIPLDAEPGGLYGSILVSSEAEMQGQTGTTVISRLGALFFVNVNGEVVKEGKLTSFAKADDENGNSSFELLFENTGNNHLNPYGYIDIFNLVGTQVGEIEIEPYFAMPDSVRFRKVEWDSGKLFGRYKAVVTMNRGYDDKVDELSLIFWVISVKILVTVLGILLLLILIIMWFIKNFDFNITKEKNNNTESSNLNTQADSNKQTTPPVQSQVSGPDDKVDLQEEPTFEREDNFS